ncbi:undecaprenol kinase [bacterium BMS3Abin07]|nr:undecaprenol kinase [bacterium BMS3Abin07]GBE31500.1 undecaprenol kinase [bacterium BMS3Bbin05]HDO21868.1 phosphatase PAP2 family protein [Nitrospirota bacterium]HDZ88633.1 phosphatase PAP2 family protein [Nitrospirota bacterium]
MPFRNWINSLNNAIDGILHTAKTERHLRYHLYAAASVLIISFILGINRYEFIFISILASIVILAEMINTAIENTVDLLSPEKRETARHAKDIAAGAVLITAFAAAVIGYFILAPYIEKAFEKGLTVAKHTPEDITIVAVTIVLISVLLIKSYIGKGKPLKGGLPSGHAALAFSVWLSITYITKNFIASLLSFLLAVIIAQNRVATKTHNALEVTTGAIMGIAITFLLFYIFS